MNQHLERILSIIQQQEGLSESIKSEVVKAIKDVDRELEIAAFKLDRTEKVKRTTAILLEETIQELELKRKDVEAFNSALQKSLEDLKSAQDQLIQSEKMASLGELTAGIAHEIKNPLNFVNNFSEVSQELLEEMQEEITKGNFEDVKVIAADVIQNLDKILHHGKRADGIVKGMLQHSRTGSGVKEPTDINALADEYLRLAYHGMRAKDKKFNVTLKTEFDETLDLVPIVPQDIGRVILNLITNAFYAVSNYTPQPADESSPYQPTVLLRTKLLKSPFAAAETFSRRRLGDLEADRVEISVLDNGPGIPNEIKDKIFQPFFTTKPTGQGTGLGLSLSYDIVKAHGGTLKVENKAAEGSEFVISLPL